MFEVCNFVVCENTQIVQLPNNAGSITIAINPQPVIRVKFIPGNISFVLSFGIFATEPLEELKSVSVQISNSQDQVVAYSIIADILIKNPDNDEIIYPTVNFDMRNVEIMTEGTYFATVKINDEQITKYPIHIKKVIS